MKSFFIYGGCVSRDVFNPEYNKAGLKISEYIARTSIVKLTEQPYQIEMEIDTEKVPSAFQRRLMSNDANNGLLLHIENNNFDWLLMDLMFLRYSLVFHGNTWLTYSSELKKSKIIKKDAISISMKDQKFWDMFQKGLDHYFDFLSKKNRQETVLLNKLYLATEDLTGKSFSSKIPIQNDYLDRAYDIMNNYLKPEQVITYDSKLFIANPEHRWGVSPMHFIDEFYHESNRKLANLWSV